MTQQPIRRSSWFLPGFAQFTGLWRTLTEPPASITEPRLRQQSRLISILCLSGLTGGLLGFTISHYGLMPDRSLLENPTIGISLTCDALVLTAYFLGRRARTLGFAPILLVAVVVGGTLASIIKDPSDYNTLVIYIVVAQVFASLLLSPIGTRVTLVATFMGLALLPLAAPRISVLSTLHVLGTIFVVSIMIAIGVTVRRRDQRTIEQQALQLSEAKAQAESANKLKSVFLGMISHELRTPLNNIMGYSDQMLMGLTGELSAGALEAAERIHRNSQNLHRMINDLLMLSRLDSGSLAIIQRPFVLADLLAEVDRTFREMAEGKGLTFSTTIDSSLPAVTTGDHQRIEQIVFNLVSNAIKFTDRGEVGVRLRRISSGEWSAQVRDTGIGIPADAASQIFDRFYQLDSTSRRSYGGAGLGLAIARELAILMGGSITVESALGAGSTFTMTLPLTMDESAIQTGEATPATQSTHTGERHGRSV